jgi:hypothetical protein
MESEFQNRAKTKKDKAEKERGGGEGGNFFSPILHTCLLSRRHTPQ